MVSRLLGDGLPGGVAVADFGAGVIDLAYEVMRGYDGLILIDVGRRRNPAGTFYVMEVPFTAVATLRDGDPIDPRAVDPRTVLRFVKALDAWPGRVMLVTCEPASPEQLRASAHEPAEVSVQRAVGLVLNAIDELESDVRAGRDTRTG